MNALVTVRDGEVRASSVDIAAAFEKAHRDVVRAIENLINNLESLDSPNVRNFAPIEVKDGRNRRQRAYEMDRDGFSLLAMGFTGAKALEWKLKFLEAFRRMEEALQASLHANDDLPIRRNGEDLEQLRASIKLVELAQRLRGTDAALRVWRAEGLPASIDDRESLAIQARSWGTLPSVRDWVTDRLEQVPETRERTSALYDDYVAFCADRGFEPASHKAFSGQLLRLGMESKKSNGMWWLGVRLKAAG